MFKTETHLHTKDSSPCGFIKAITMVRRYAEAGYSTLFITDHLTGGFSDKLGDLPWNDKVTIFLAGYYRARLEGEKLGVRVLMAAEVGLRDYPKNHYLVYNIDKAFLEKCEHIFDMNIEQFCDFAHAHGAFVVQAHPFRDGHCFPTPQCIDALEVHNPNPRHENDDERCMAVAAEHHLPMTAGSDAHRDEDVTGTGILTEEKIECAADYLRLLQNGGVQIYYPAQEEA